MTRRVEFWKREVIGGSDQFDLQLNNIKFKYDTRLEYMVERNLSALGLSPIDLALSF